MMVNSAIRNLIREGKLTVLAEAIRDYGQGGNTTIDEALFKLYWQGTITMETVIKYCREPEEVRRLTSEALTRKKIPVSKT
jgi:Tfp pilus assembly pilus retraction ATPase PilT